MAERHHTPTTCASCPLKKRDVFRAATPSELEFIAAFKTGEFAAEPGATILLEGTSSPHLYTVLAGWAFRYKLLPDGRRQILNFVLPGDFIGLQGTMLNEMQHSVEALSQVVLCVFARDRLWSLYSEHPSLAYDLTWLASRSERLLDENLLSVGRRTALERLACVILDVFFRARALGLTSGSRLKAPFTQQHIADALGLSLVHTNKTLKRLTDAKLLNWAGRTITLLDEPGLIEAGKFEVSEQALRPLI